jgi:hypothetical protein
MSLVCGDVILYGDILPNVEYMQTAAPVLIADLNTMATDGSKGLATRDDIDISDIIQSFSHEDPLSVEEPVENDTSSTHPTMILYQQHNDEHHDSLQSAVLEVFTSPESRKEIGGILLRQETMTSSFSTAATRSTPREVMLGMVKRISDATQVSVLSEWLKTTDAQRIIGCLDLQVYHRMQLLRDMFVKHATSIIRGQLSPASLSSMDMSTAVARHSSPVLGRKSMHVRSSTLSESQWGMSDSLLAITMPRSNRSTRPLEVRNPYTGY